jgi:hypothetical protein
MIFAQNYSVEGKEGLIMTRIKKLKALQELSRVKKGLDVIKSEKDYKKIQKWQGEEFLYIKKMN